MEGNAIFNKGGRSPVPNPNGVPMVDPGSKGTWRPPMPKLQTWVDLTERGAVEVRKMQFPADENSTTTAGPRAESSAEPKASLTSQIAKNPARWLEQPSPPPAPPNASIWHYTDAGGFLGIVESRCLWATALAFLNDREEYVYGLNVFDETVKEALESFYVHPAQKEFLRSAMNAAREPKWRLRTFVACASLAADSLAQWRGYSSGSGYAIGIDPEAHPVVLADGGDDGLLYDAVEMSWSRVLYERHEQLDLVNRTLGFVLQLSPTPKSTADVSEQQKAAKMAAAQIVTSSCYIKHPSFMEEQEVRAILSVGEMEESNIRYRATPYGIAPYLLATFISSAPAKEIPGKVHTADLMPITHLRLSPGPHEETRMQGAQDFLHSTGHDVSVSLSSSPFR